MSAIQSLLRVMTLRDAEAIILETGKIPSLRRRGQIEKLAMPALEAEMLEGFVAPLIVGRSLEDGAVSVVFHEVDGPSYPVTIEKSAAGLRLVVRPGKVPVAKPVAKPAGMTAEAASRAVWARPEGGAVEATAWPQGADGAGSQGASAADGAMGARLHSAMGAGSQGGTGAGAMGAGLHGVGPQGAMGGWPQGAAMEAHAVEARGRLEALLAPFVAVAKERGASDVIVSTVMSRLKVAGRLEEAGIGVDEAELAACVGALGSNSDHSLEIEGTRLRVNLFDHLSGFAVAARLIRDRVPGLGELGLPAELAGVVEQRDGLVLVCGPTGSGKSTTLAAMLDVLDQRRAAHVITLEDPIEYRFTPRRGMMHQREVGQHIPSFAAGLRAALREAPDVILIGELRDRETIAAALTAAETGHLVLATLHAPSAAGAIDRMIDAFPELQQRQARSQLAAVLRTVITQYLLPRRDGGRAPAIELVPVTASVANIMRKGDLQMLASAIQTGRDAGMIPLERSLARLLESGMVSRDAVRAIAADLDLLSALASKLR